jgi:hypothetical protein
MTGLLRHSIWFGRVVLVAAIFLFSAIAMKNLGDPIAAVAPHEITLGSAAGITVARVGFGAFPLGFAIVLATCLISERRLLIGLGFLSILAIVVTAVRVFGAVVDGPAPFTLMVLKPEVALIFFSTLAYFVERRRNQLSGGPPVISRLAVPR